MERMHHFFHKVNYQVFIVSAYNRRILVCIDFFSFPLKKVVTEGLYPTDNKFRTRIMEIFLADLEFR